MHMRTKSITIHHVTLRYRIPIMSNLNQKQLSLSDNEARQDRFLTQVAYFIVHGPVLWELNGSGSPNFSFQKLWRLPCSTSKYIENCSVYMDNCQYIPLLIHSIYRQKIELRRRSRNSQLPKLQLASCGRGLIT
jgi:hypothetical protein